MTDLKSKKVDTSKVIERANAVLTRDEKWKLSSGGEGEMPTDLPITIEVERVMRPLEGHNPPMVVRTAVAGHVLRLNLYSVKRMLTVKLFRDPLGFQVLLDGEQMHLEFANPADMPHKVHEVIEEFRRLGGEFVDQVDLQPGDEVIEGDDGELVIVRANELDDDELLFDDEDDEPLVFWDDEDDDIIEGELE